MIASDLRQICVRLIEKKGKARLTKYKLYPEVGGNKKMINKEDRMLGILMGTVLRDLITKCEKNISKNGYEEKRNKVYLNHNRDKEFIFEKYSTN